MVLFVALFPLQPLTLLRRRVYLATTRVRKVPCRAVAEVEAAEEAVQEVLVSVAIRQAFEGQV